MIADTIETCLKNALRSLQATQDAAQLEAEILLAYTLVKPRTYLRAWPQHKLEQKQIYQFLHYVKRRVSGEPIAYIVGSREFWSLDLKVSSATLIPRPETERLVELALEKIPDNTSCKIADLGTGSGAIALAIAKERPLCQIIATDVTPQAIEVAKTNRQTHTLTNVEFIQSDWFEALPKTEKFDFIITNPPYIASGDPHLQQGDLLFEPKTALTSGPDGLDSIGQIVADSTTYLKPGGWIMLEHGYNQAMAVAELLKESGFSAIRCISDYAQNERVSIGQVS